MWYVHHNLLVICGATLAKSQNKLPRRVLVCYIRRPLLWERQMLPNLGRLPSHFRTPCTGPSGSDHHDQLSRRSQGPYVTHQAQSRCRYPALSAVSTASAASLGLDCQVPTILQHSEHRFLVIASGAPYQDPRLGWTSRCSA